MLDWNMVQHNNYEGCCTGIYVNRRSDTLKNVLVRNVALLNLQILCNRSVMFFVFFINVSVCPGIWVRTFSFCYLFVLQKLWFLTLFVYMRKWRYFCWENKTKTIVWKSCVFAITCFVICDSNDSATGSCVGRAAACSCSSQINLQWH